MAYGHIRDNQLFCAQVVRKVTQSTIASDISSLADLDAFVAVARARSFRAAANLRGVSASALSTALRRLEARLGVRLLNRTTRSVTATEAGERLLARLAPCLQEVAAALNNIHAPPGSLTGTLRLNVPTVVASLVLPSLLPRFLACHPGINVEVRAEDDLIDVLAAGFDAGIRYDERLERDMIAVPIGPRIQRYVAAAAPAYLARHGLPMHPRDVVNHICIRHRFTSGICPAWEFERDQELIRASPKSVLIVNMPDLQVETAVQGLGLIYMFEGYVTAALAAGLLTPVLEDWWQSFSGPFLYYPSRRHMPPPLRAFVDFLKTDLTDLIGGSVQAD